MDRRTGHIKAIRIFAAALLVFASAACTREDWSDCDPLLEIRFTFTKNPAGTERFSDELTRLDVFIFDGKGCFVKALEDERTRFPENYVMTAELPAEGAYTVVAVGNSDDSFHLGKLGDYSSGCTPLEPGVSTLSDFRLMHALAGSVSNGRLCDIFHGIAQIHDLKADVTGRCNVALTKNTNTLDITVSGLGNVVTRSLYPTVGVEAQAGNGANMFDNSLDRDAPAMKYAPFQRSIDGTNLKVQLSVLRLTTGCAMPLVITDNSVEIGTFDLIREILKSPDYSSDDDLDKEDTFKIDITFDSAGDFTIRVNGWQTTGSGGIVG